MIKLNTYDIEGKEAGSIDLKDEVFGVEVNKCVITDAVLNELANKRRGTANTKTRAEVRGGGKKPWRQKGTGRARHGSIREPQWKGGGVAHGPKPRSYYYRLPKKVKVAAYKSIMSDKIKGNNILVLDELKFTGPKTKQILGILNKFNLGNLKTLLIVNEKNDNLKRAVNNLLNVKILYLNNLNCFDLMRFGKLIFTKSAIFNLEKQLLK